MAKAIGTSWTTLKTYDWVPGTGFRVSFYLEARYSSSEKNNIEGNYSNIYTRLRSVVHAGQGSGYGYNFTCSYAPDVKGSSIWYLGTEVITESGITKITHENDGTKTIRLTATGSISPIGLNFSISEDVVLDTIPRATTLLDQSGTIGHNLVINWSPASDKFTHKLTYSFGSIKDEVLGTGLKKSFTWSIPTKLYKEFTGQSAKGTLKLTTYSGSTQIGSPQEVSLTIYANQSFSEPVIDGASLKDINSTTVALTGDNGTFILGRSKLFLTLTFKTRNFATLKSLSINGTTIANNKVTAGKQSTDGTTVYGLEYEYGTLNTKQLLFKVTDTRNYAVELKTIISDSIVINYVPLTAVTTFKRITPTGGKVGLVFNGNYFNGSFGATSNTLEISYKYKKSTDSTYTTVNLVNNTDYKISGNTYYSGTGSSKQTITLAPTFDYKTQYDVQVIIKDKLTTLPIINAIISKGIPIMWWNGSKVVVNGELDIATSDGAVQTTIKNGAISTNGTLSANGKRADILLQNKFATRPTNANVAPDGSGGLSKFLSSSSMTSNKPTNNGHIIQMHWDTTAGWDSQLFVGNGPDPRIRVRAQNSGTWGSWQEVATTPVVLYNNSNGTQGTITLSQSAANFVILEIFYGRTSGGLKSTRVYSPNNKYASLSYEWFDKSNSSNVGHITAKKEVKISGTRITNSYIRRIYFYPNYTKPLEDGNDNVSIFTVIGYK